MPSETNLPAESFRQQAWDYFQMHAGQRLSTFNFYVVISSVFSTALFGVFQKNYLMPRVAVIVGFLLGFFSFVFWRLDLRNREFIKNAENALEFFESTYGPQEGHEGVHVTKLFLAEKYRTQARRTRFFLWRRHWSYSDCFNVVFLAFACVGLLGVIGGLLTGGR